MNLLALPAPSALLLAPTSPNSAANEENLRAADAEQMRIIVEGDAKAQQEFMHPNYIINAPANVVQRKAALVADLARGAMGSENFKRVIEGMAITGNVGIVMGAMGMRHSISVDYVVRTPATVVASLLTLLEQDGEQQQSILTGSE